MQPYTVQYSADARDTVDLEADSPEQARDLALARLPEGTVPEYLRVLEPIPCADQHCTLLH